jgi:hypothetical protein
MNRSFLYHIMKRASGTGEGVKPLTNQKQELRYRTSFTVQSVTVRLTRLAQRGFTAIEMGSQNLVHAFNFKRTHVLIWTLVISSLGWFTSAKHLLAQIDPRSALSPASLAESFTGHTLV